MNMQDVVTVVMLDRAGHEDNHQMLAGFGIANILMNCFGLSIFQGLNESIGTLASIEAGAGNYRVCGEYLNRGRFVMTVAFLPLCIIYFNAETLLVSIKQDAVAARYAQEYINSYWFGLYIAGLYDG